MISLVMLIAKKFFVKKTSRVSAWQSHTSNLIPNRDRQRMGSQHLRAPGPNLHQSTGHLDSPSVRGDAGGSSIVGIVLLMMEMEGNSGWGWGAQINSESKRITII